MISNKKLQQLSLKAAEEIGETGIDLLEMVDNLKRQLQENYKDLALPSKPEEFLLRFLRGSKFNVSSAAKKVSQYFKVLHQLKNIHHIPCNSTSVERLFRENVFTVFSERDSKGRVVILFRHEFLPPTPDWVEQVMVALFILGDYLHRSSVDTQRIGFVVVVDLNTFSWAHCAYASPSVVLTVAKFVTQAYPGRIKGYHFVRNPPIFNYMLALVKPFVSKKIKGRLHFHGWNFQKLHDMSTLSDKVYQSVWVES